jgi:hypothetical protein
MPTADVLPFPRNEPECQWRRADAARFFAFAGDREAVLGRDASLDKAAAFQELRDCLASADEGRISRTVAERRAQYLLHAYLYGY